MRSEFIAKKNGFWITIGDYTISVQFYVGNFCDNNCSQWLNKNAEVAILHKVNFVTKSILREMNEEDISDSDGIIHYADTFIVCKIAGYLAKKAKEEASIVEERKRENKNNVSSHKR